MFLFYIIILIINVLFNMNQLLNSIYDSLYIWFYNIFPSIFIFYIISSYLIHNSFINKLSLIFKIITKFDSNKSYNILFTNVFLGNPGTTKLILNAYDNNEISKHDFILLNNITIFMNPLFILTIINIKYYIIYLISTIIYIKIYNIIFKHKKYSNNFSDIVRCKYTVNTFFKSINDVTYILLNVAGLVTFFNVFKSTINYSISFVSMNNKIINTVLSFLEVASGLNYLNKLNNLYLIILLISFQGICIIMQSFSIISEKNISFIRYILNHFISAIFITLIFILLVTLFHI